MAASFILTPLNQTPDEQTQLLRSIQVSYGHIISTKNTTMDCSGGIVPKNIIKEMGLYVDLRGHPERKASAADLQALMNLRWGKSIEFLCFPNTATYGPFFYMPQAAVIAVSRYFDVPIILSLYITRFFSLIISFLFLYLSIRLFDSYKSTLVLIVTLPMNIFLESSVSQEGLIITFSTLLASILSRMSDQKEWKWYKWLFFGIGFGSLGTAKIPLVLLSLLIPLHAPRQMGRAAWGSVIVAGSMTIAWLWFGVIPTKTQLIKSPEYSDARQIDFLLHNLPKVIAIVSETIESNGFDIFDSMVGRLGWLEVVLPYGFSLYWFLTVLIVTSLSSFRSSSAPRIMVFTNVRTALTPITSLVLLVACAMAIAFSLYVIWTKVGANKIDGIQGRYFLPLLPFILASLPRPKSIARRSRLIDISDVLMIAWLVVDTVVFITAVSGRYY